MKHSSNYIIHEITHTDSDGSAINAGGAGADTEKTNSVKSKSVAVRTFSYFVIFIITIMITLWMLQILFLQTFYQEMKMQELYKVAKTIESNYGSSVSELYDTISSLTQRSDMYIQIEIGGFVTYTNDSNPGDRMNILAKNYNTEKIKNELLEGNHQSVVVKQSMSKGGSTDEAQAMIYASILNKDSFLGNTYLFIYSPLSAVGTTIDILAKMLIMVTVISIVLGLILSIIISRRLAKPLNSITASAALLAKGDYSVNFNGYGYRETEELASTLNYASEELSKSDKLQKDLVANVSHDLKTPLTMVKSYAEMIRDLSGDNPEKRNKHLQVIITEADRLNDLVNDLTTLSKMQANVDALNPTPVNLELIAKETMDSFSLHAEQEGFTFSITVEGSSDVVCDEKKIRQVFANLVGNAVRYSSEDKRVGITIIERENTVRCEVSDHGQGIAAEDIDSIWDRYYQSSSNHSRNSKGSGLGLSIVKQIFVLHKAKYGVISRENEGSTFWFELKKTIS